MSSEMMNTVVNESVIDELVVNPTKVLRSLPAKYNKFASFAFWLLREMKDNTILSSVTYDNTCSMMNLLSGDIPLQIDFYEKFFSEMKVSDRLMKSEIRSYKENNKNKKTKENKPKKTRNNKKNTNNTDNTDDIISLIVMKANGVDVGTVDSDLTNHPQNEIVVDQIPEKVEKVEKKKRVKKPKTEENVLQTQVVESESSEKVESESPEKVESESSEKVEKKKRVKKPKTEENVLQTQVVESESPEKVEKKKRVKKPKTEENVLQTQVIETETQEKTLNITTTSDTDTEITLSAVTIDGVEYFYDLQNQLYNSSYDIIGSIDTNSLSISIP